MNYYSKIFQILTEVRGDQYGMNIAWPGQPGSKVTDEPPERGSTRSRRWAKRLKKFRGVGSSPHTDPKDQKEAK